MSYTDNEARHGAPVLRFDEVAIAPPGVEPVTVAEVKAHRRLDADDTGQDALIALLITMAREYLESYTGRKLITQDWRATVDGFPGITQPSPEIPLPYGPLQQVLSIQYLEATAGTLTTMDPSKYIVDISGVRPRIAPRYGNQWPDTWPQVGAVQIRMRLGYGETAAAVPAGLRHWILLRVGTLFENREEVAILGRGKVEPLPFVDGLLDPYKVPVI